MSTSGVQKVVKMSAATTSTLVLSSANATLLSYRARTPRSAPWHTFSTASAAGAASAVLSHLHLSSTHHTCLFSSCASRAGTGRGTCSSSPYEEDDEMRERREWMEKFKDVKLDAKQFEVTYTRSSGPGGQNVNKVSTKANVRVDLSRASSGPQAWLLKSMVGKLAKESPYYIPSSHSLLLSSMRHRSQEANLVDALEKLQTHILTLSSHSLINPTPASQRSKVARLAAAHRAKVREDKVRRGSVKAGRRNVGGRV